MASIWATTAARIAYVFVAGVVKYAFLLISVMTPMRRGNICDSRGHGAAFHPSNGDQAGSEASVGVVTTRSLKPVMSMETSREP